LVDEDSGAGAWSHGPPPTARARRGARRRAAGNGISGPISFGAHVPSRWPIAPIRHTGPSRPRRRLPAGIIRRRASVIEVPQPFLERLPEKKRRRRGRALLGLAVAVLLALACGIAWLLFRDPLSALPKPEADPVVL